MFIILSLAHFLSFNQFQSKKIKTNSNLGGKSAKEISNGIVLISHFTISNLDRFTFFNSACFFFQPESCPEADSSMSHDRSRSSSSYGYHRRSKSMERKDSVRRRSLDYEAKDDSNLTVEKGMLFLHIYT